METGLLNFPCPGMKRGQGSASPQAVQIKNHLCDAPALNSAAETPPNTKILVSLQQKPLMWGDVGGFGQTHPCQVCSGCGSEGAPGTALLPFPPSDLCSVLLPAFTPQNPEAGEVLQVLIDVQPLGKPLVLFVLLDRQIHSASVAAALSPVPSSL